MGGWLCLGDKEYRKKSRLEGRWGTSILDMMSVQNLSEGVKVLDMCIWNLEDGEGRRKNCGMGCAKKRESNI